jgi:hypothetical protein
MTTISHYQLLHWAHQIAQDATQSAVDSAQSMISTLKLQSVIAADYK